MMKSNSSKDILPHLHYIPVYAPDAIFIHDYNGNIIYTNEKATDYTNFSSSELESMTVMEIDANYPDLTILQQEWNKLKNQKSITLIGEHRRKDKTTFPVEIHLTSYILDKKPFYLAFVRDITKRVNLEKRLHQTQMYYTDFITMSTDTVSYWKTPDNLKTDLPIEVQIEMLYHSIALDANRASWENFSLNSKEQMIGKEFSQLIKRRTYDVVFSKFIRNDYNLNNYEVTMIAENGTVYYGLESWHGVVENGVLSYIWTTSKDITRIRQYEDDLQKSKTKLNNIQRNYTEFINISNDPISYWKTPPGLKIDLPIDMQTNMMMSSICIDINRAGWTAFGLNSKEEVIGQQILMLMKEIPHPDFLSNFIKNDYHIDGYLLHGKRPDGSDYYGLINLYGFVENGELVNVWAFSKDFTEFMLLKQKLLQHERLLGDVEKIMNSGGFEYTVKTGEIYWTDGLYELHEVSRGSDVDPITLSLNCYLQEDRDRIAKAFQKCIEEGIVYDLEFPFTTCKQNHIWIRTKSKPIYEDGNIVKVIGSVINITEQKEARQQLEKALGEKETLLRELYHRTKNNMQVINSLLELQVRFSKNDYIKEILSETKNRIMAMALVHRKLYQAKDLSSINLKEYIHDLVDALMKSFKLNIHKDKIALHFVMEDITVLIDIAIPCGLVLNELITNIFKYAFPQDRKGTMTIELSKNPPNEIFLKVSDNGVGLPDGFDVYKDGKLGLKNIVSLIEYQLNGSIKIESVDGLTYEIRFVDNLFEKRI